jgi:hypothetical protein
MSGFHAKPTWAQGINRQILTTSYGPRGVQRARAGIRSLAEPYLDRTSTAI